MGERTSVMKPDTEKGIECYMGFNLSSGWNQDDGKEPGLVLPRKGYVITYAKRPIIWAIRLQTEIALSTMEAAYIAL